MHDILNPFYYIGKHASDKNLLLTIRLPATEYLWLNDHITFLMFITSDLHPSIKPVRLKELNNEVPDMPKISKGVNLNCVRDRYMVEQRRGRIITISSRAYLGAKQMANYAASKAGILGLTRSLSLELGPFGITVNAIAPGTIDTEPVKEMFKGFLEERVRSTPVGRIGAPEEIANAVVFLASSEASYITGEVLHVTGGFY